MLEIRNSLKDAMPDRTLVTSTGFPRSASANARHQAKAPQSPDSKL